MQGTSGLSELEKRMLVFEREWAAVPMRAPSGALVAAWQAGGAKVAAVKTEFGISETRYLQVLNALLEKPEALAEDPMTVGRLRRLRERYRRSGRDRRGQ